MTDLSCISCNKKIVNNAATVQFPCPACAKYTIIRCGHCRSLATKYTCPSCSFVGPN